MKEIDEPINWVVMLAHRIDNESIAQFLIQFESLIFSLIVALLVSVFFCFAAKKKELIPTGLQNGLECAIEYMQAGIVSILGPDGKKYLPFLGSLFIYILCMNIFGLLPLMKSPSSSINITAAHAICVFLLVQYLSIKQMGVKGLLYHLSGSPKTVLQWILVPLLFPIELMTQLTRPITLAFRLFGNIFGEDILIGYFVLLGVSVLPYMIPLPLQLPFLFFALFTSVIQALVFTLLTTVYILLSIPEEGKNH